MNKFAFLTFFFLALTSTSYACERPDPGPLDPHDPPKHDPIKHDPPAAQRDAGPQECNDDHSLHTVCTEK